MTNKAHPFVHPDHLWAKSAARKSRNARLTHARLSQFITTWLSGFIQGTSQAHVALAPSPKAEPLAPPPSLAALARFHELTHAHRSDHGVYYTPPDAAAFMARAALAAWQSANPRKSLRNLTLLDPAAGTGDLLLAARNQLPKDFSGRLIAIDTDADALAIARARLLENHPHLATRIITHAGSGLTPGLAESLGQADILLLNPPYVPAYSRRSRKTKLLPDAEKSASGRVNLFTRFIHAIQTLTNSGGIACTITPDTLAFADSYAADRAHLAARFPSQHWLLIEKKLFDAAVQNVIGIFAPGTPQSFSAQLNHIPSSVPAWIRTAPPGSHPVIFYKHPVEPALERAIANLSGPLLSDLFHVKDGINPGPAHMREKLITPLDPPPATRDSGRLSPLLTGRDISPTGFSISKPTLGIRYDPALLTPQDTKAGCSLRNPVIFQSPKLVSRQTANMPVVGIDLNHSHYSSNSVHNIRAIDPAHAPFLWGLMAYLNSPAVRLYYALSGGETRATLPQVRIAWLNRLPLPPNWQPLFETLAPLAQSLARKRKPNPAILKEVHHTLCANLHLSDPAAIAQAYQTRFNKPAF